MTSDLAQALLERLAQRGYQLLSLESCTGGQIAAALTALPGASKHYLGGYVCYANSFKLSLGVRSRTLERHGAVSAETVRELLQAGLKQSSADLALAVSGVAGPGGGSAAKPVGTVFLGWQLRAQRGCYRASFVRLATAPRYSERQWIWLYSARWNCST